MGKTNQKINPVVQASLDKKRQGNNLVNGERTKIKEKEAKERKYVRPQEEEDLWMLRLAEVLKGTPEIIESLDIYPDLKEARVRASIGANI